MIIAKIGGSLIAPKHKSNFVDEIYLEQISNIRNNIDNNKIFIHGAGNIGHGFIKQYGLNYDTYIQGRVLLQGLNNTVNNYIGGIRLYPDELQFITPHSQGSFICGGDIIPQLTISSGDDQFPQIINQTNSPIGYIFTDVDGVLDSDNTIVEIISKDTINNITFWNVENDVTGGMKSKIYKLIEQINHPCIIRIANGYDFDNMQLLLSTGNGKGTQIIIS